MKLRIKNTVYIGVIFLSIMLLWQAYNWFVPRFLESAISERIISRFGESQLTTVWVGMVMGLDNLLALFMIPVVSKLSDKTNTRIGKRMPYIVVGLPVAAMAFALVPVVQNKLALLIPVLMVVLIAMNVFRSPAVALMPDITPKTHRSKANAVINMMGGIGTGIGFLTVLISDKIGLPSRVPIMSISVIMLVCFIFAIFKIDEKKFIRQMDEDLRRHYGENSKLIQEEKEEDDESHLTESAYESNKKSGSSKKRHLLDFILTLCAILFFYAATNAIETFMSTYTSAVFGDDTKGVTALVGLAIGNFSFMVPSALIAEKFGRKITLISGSIVMSIATFCAYFIKDYSGWVIIPFIVFGIGMSLMVINMYPLLISYCTKDNYAKYTGYYYVVTMFAQAFTPALVGFFISPYFYGITHNNAEQAVGEVRYLMLYASIFMVLCAASLIFVRNQKPSK